MLRFFKVFIKFTSVSIQSKIFFIGRLFIIAIYIACYRTNYVIYILLVHFLKFYFIIFTFTYMCIHCLGHLPPLPHCLWAEKQSFHQFEMKIAIQGESLCCFHAHVHYNPNWFICIRSLHYFLVPFP
jgi:hypothetical protein